MRRAAIGLATLCSLLVGGPALAVASATMLPLQMTDVTVVGGEDAWHPDPEFQIEWDTAAAPLEQVVAVNHRVLDPNGTEVPYSRGRGEKPGGFFHTRVPEQPGIYTVEAWLESRLGGEGPHVTAKLRFDDRPPAPARPVGPGGWVAGSAHAAIRIGHPEGPLPISGIRGYAYSIDREEGGRPCAGATLCTAAEIGLGDGVDDDQLTAPTLSEGTNYVHVVAVSGSGVHSQEIGTAPIRVDAGYPQLRLDGIPAGWSKGPVTVVASATDRLSGMEAGGPDGPFTAIGVDGAAAARRQGPLATADVSGDGIHRVSYFARDAAGNVTDGADGAPPPDIATVRIDGSPPHLAFAAASDPENPERIEATVSDPLSGPSSDRGLIEIRPAGTAAAFEALPTTVEAGRLVARWDSDSHPAGRYELRATGWDAAGNSATSSRRAGGAEMILANPVKEPVLLEAGFGGHELVWQRCRRHRGTRRCRRQVLSDFGSRPSTRTVSFGHGVAFAGRARTAAGSPAGDIEVSVVEEFASGATIRTRTTSVHTDSEGFFALHLGPGPSRRISATFSGDRRLSRSSSAAVWLGVLGAVRFAASTSNVRVGGRPVAFRGKVIAGDASIPSDGRPVELQFRYPGAGWSEFRTVESEPSGHFRYPYSFSDDDSRGIRFQFRACAPSQPDWPFEPACSRPVTVTGR
jgi:hypothetical protein